MEFIYSPKTKVSDTGGAPSEDRLVLTGETSKEGKRPDAVRGRPRLIWYVREHAGSDLSRDSGQVGCVASQLPLTCSSVCVCECEW